MTTSFLLRPERKKKKKKRHKRHTHPPQLCWPTFRCGRGTFTSTSMVQREVLCCPASTQDMIVWCSERSKQNKKGANRKVPSSQNAITKFKQVEQSVERKIQLEISAFVCCYWRLNDLPLVWQKIRKQKKIKIKINKTKERRKGVHPILPCIRLAIFSIWNSCCLHLWSSNFTSQSHIDVCGTNFHTKKIRFAVVLQISFLHNAQL